MVGSCLFVLPGLEVNLPEGSCACASHPKSLRGSTMMASAPSHGGQTLRRFGPRSKPREVGRASEVVCDIVFASILRVCDHRVCKHLM